MTVTDSRVPSVRTAPSPYVTSSPRESTWGQPSASYYVFEVEGAILRGQPISGVYAPSGSSAIPPVDAELLAAFETWDALSSEALENFEASLE